MASRYIVGIDLGTTNSALAHVDVEAPGRKLADDPVLQLVAPGEVAPRSTLPSFLYLAGGPELPPAALRLPWHGPEQAPETVVGELARAQGRDVTARLVSSAKSWLCHPQVDRLAPILPWGEAAAPELRKVSPVDASAAYLEHLSQSWRQSTGRTLSDEELVLCVPASFDEVARELTLRAAERQGLRPTLLEEPQAAFYAWLAEHGGDQAGGAAGSGALSPGDLVLVFDVGGGTTDFSLIAIHEGEGTVPRLERTAVGDHLLLGGDNMDLALARRVETRLARGGARLDPHTFGALVQACRVAKERLLGDETRSSWTVTVAGRGSRLIGGALKDELTRAEVEELVLDGFFPRVEAEAAPARGRGSVLQEFGLPYAAEPGITRHAAAFLRAHGARPTAILWNGGVLKSPAIRARILEVMGSWLGAPPRVLENSSPDLAVARGAAYYGLARRGLGLRISGGAARAYYLGVDTAQVTPGRHSVICLTPRGMPEGTAQALDGHALEALTNRPVRFRLFSSSERVGDVAGGLYSVEEGALAELPPIYTVLRFARSSQDVALSVYLEARLTELGTLELECVARGTGHEEDRWKLAFDLRAAEARAGDAPAIAGEGQASSGAAAEGPLASGPSAERGPATPAAPHAQMSDAADPEALARAIAFLHASYGKEPASAAEPAGEPVTPPGLMKTLQGVLGPKDGWSPTTLRALWDPLKELRGGRGKSPRHEARWMNLVGYALRPGFGYPLDDWRVKEVWRLFNAGLVHDKDEACRLEWWILWRRVSGGLTRTQQDELYKRVAPHFLPAFAKRSDRKAPGPQEAAEMWRTLASMERLPPKQKVELGEVLLAQLEKKKAPEHALWALGRLGARVPLYGPPEEVVPIKKAERWLERLMALEWKSEPFALAAAELARCSGDRARDLDDALRRRLGERLRPGPDGARLARLVLEPTAREAREERLAFGDALPSGLRLIADDT